MSMSKLKQLYYRAQKSCIHFVYKARALFLVGKVPKDTLVMRVDGGVCSQMHFYLIGQLFREKGMTIKYDISWFENNGKDNNGKYVRNFDLLKLFPKLQIDIATNRDIAYTKQNIHYNNIFNEDSLYALKYLETVTPPCYLDGYYKEPSYFYTETFHKYFKADYSVLDDHNRDVLNSIQKQENPVAVHVRRGDLAQYNEAYGSPCTNDYFVESVNYIIDRFSDVFFYFFSDEPQWVRNALAINLPSGTNYMIVDINGSDRGYMDLLLMSACKHHITSKGTLGKYGALLSRSNGVVICADDQKEHRWNVIGDVVFI